MGTVGGDEREPPARDGSEDGGAKPTRGNTGDKSGNG